MKKLAALTILFLSLNIFAGEYIQYSPGAFASASGKKVLFFSASWCPVCVKSDKEFSSAKIPGKLVIFKVDYDTETELKKKYKIVSQHTFVYVDDKGNELKKWSGGNLEEVVKNTGS